MWWKLLIGYGAILLSAPQLFFWPIAIGTLGLMVMMSGVLENHQRKIEYAQRHGERPLPASGSTGD